MGIGQSAANVKPENLLCHQQESNQAKELGPMQSIQGQPILNHTHFKPRDYLDHSFGESKYTR